MNREVSLFPLVRLTAVLLAVAASAVVWYAPLYAGHMSSTDAAGRTTERDVRSTVPEVNGHDRILIYVSIPIAMAICPLLASRLKTTCAVVLLVLCLIASMSIGLLYVPAGLVLLIPERRLRGVAS